MFKLSTNSSTAKNSLTKAMRKAKQKDQALSITKLYSHIKDKEFDTIPTTGTELAKYYTGDVLTTLQVSVACANLIEVLEFEEIEEDCIYDIPEVVTAPAIESRYSFMDTTDFNNMSAHQLSLCLFKDLGSEIEVKILSMQTGFKSKLYLLDELKANIVAKYPDIRLEVIENKLANAMVITKLKTGSALSIDPSSGNLSLYQYYKTTLVGSDSDVQNMSFLAAIAQNKQQTLDIMILQSAFKSYKEAVASGLLPVTSNEFNLAVTKIIQGVLPTTQTSIDLL